jgi:hypothetical protein
LVAENRAGRDPAEAGGAEGIQIPPGNVISDLLIIVSFNVAGRKGIYEKLVLWKDSGLKNASLFGGRQIRCPQGTSP